MNTPAGPDDLATFAGLVAAGQALSDDLKRDPATMARGLDPEYRMRPHLRLIGEAMAQIPTGEVDRLLVITPQQVGKSTLVAEWGPFWWLANRPGDDIVIASYAADLAEARSKGVQQLIANHGGGYGLAMRKHSEAIHDWRTTTGGHLRAIGVGGGLTGFPANCLSYDTHVRTQRGSMPIGVYVESGCTDPVLSYNHEQGRAQWSPVVATSVSRRHVVDIITTGGRTVRCTADHRIFVRDRGYVPAGDLRPGDGLCTAADRADEASRVDLRPLRRPVPAPGGQAAGSYSGGPLLLAGVQQPGALPSQTLQGLRGRADQPAQDVLLSPVPPSPIPDHTGLRRLRVGLHHHQLRACEADTQRAEDLHLFQAVLGPDAGHPVPPVRFRGQEGPRVLFTGVQSSGRVADPAHTDHARLRAMRVSVPAAIESAAVLLPVMRQRRPLDQDDRVRQFALQGRAVVRELVPGHATVDHGAGAQPLRHLRDHGAEGAVRAAGSDLLPQRLPHPSHQRGPNRQPPRQPGRAVQDLPRQAPPLGYDTVAEVRPVRGGSISVYDLQVAGTHNFFAGQILVHNCIFLDDPHADRAQAESDRYRNAVHDWWSSTALSRLQPDMGAVVAIQTRWHPDDFAGRRLKEEGRTEEGGRWRVIHLPAVADAKFGPDPLGRAPGDPLTHPKIPTRDGAALAAWWAEKKRTMMVRDWHALCQGDPQPAGGALVTDELLRLIRDTTTPINPIKIAVGVDPSGGGRSTAGVVGGFLGEDKRLWITHDRTAVMSAAQWSRCACLLADETDATIIFVEANYGGDAMLLALRSTWRALQGELDDAGRPLIDPDKLCPAVVGKHAKLNKLLRAEPVAQQMHLDRVRLRGLFVDMEREWSTWQPTDKASPGRIDASVVLAYGLLPIPGAGFAQVGIPTGQLPTTGSSPLSGPMGGSSGLGPLG